MCIKLALLGEEGQLSVSFIKVEGNANSHVGSLSCVTVSFGGASSCHCGNVAVTLWVLGLLYCLTWFVGPDYRYLVL